MARVSVGDVQLNVSRAGAGEALVLLHGFTGSAAQWAPQVAVFARTFATVAVDLLGHGASDAPPDPRRYRMERGVEDLAVLLDRLGIGAAHWLGYSMGARLALAVAVAHPRRVRSLVLEGGSPGIADAPERQARIAHDEALARHLERDGIDVFVDRWMQQPLFASQARLGPAALAAARAARRANSVIGLANTLRGMGTGAQEPLWRHLPMVSAPTLLIAGAEDAKFRDIAAAMAVRMPAARVVLIAQAGHAAHLENPLRFNEAVLTFLCARHTGASVSRTPVSTP